jgi:hypothetical protein
MNDTNDTMSRFKKIGKTKLINSTILCPEYGNLALILNLANMAGKAESPLMPLFDKKWRKVKEDVRGWYVNKTGEYKLGAINRLAVQSDVWVIHMLCQDLELKTDVKALKDCLKKVCALAKYEKAGLHVSTLLTDSIPEMADLLTEMLVNEGVSVYFYQEPAARTA